MSGLPPLSLYIHIPWCERKCPYCDFNSHRAEKVLPEGDYVRTLLADLDADLHHAQDRELVSIFIGGGTPSLFSAQAIETLLAGVGERLALAADCEITMEANPGSAEADKFAGFRAAGVNRVSLGVQSFADESLQVLGRVHDSEQAQAAIGMAQAAGFNSINIDLMHGLPGQDAAGAQRDLETAIAFGTAHLSWYQLTIERNTEFWKRPPTLPVEDELADIQDRGEALLAAAGFVNYEVSAYARDGMRCRHNLNYWEFGDYLGIGAGAHGKITDPDSGRVLRTAKRKQPAEYLVSPSGSERSLETRELVGDFMLNALRLSDGFRPGLFPERTGLDLEEIEKTLSSLTERALLSREVDCVRPTALGRRFLDSVIGEFL